jgi:two-component system OmpR family response regulator
MTATSSSGGAPQRTVPAPPALLLVDDDAELCALMVEYFTEQGYRLDVVVDGRDGLARALTGQYDLVLLDVMLPSLDGFEILRQLRRQSRTPVIMLTARTQENDRIEGLEAGVIFASRPSAPWLAGASRQPIPRRECRSER